VTSVLRKQNELNMFDTPGVTTSIKWMVDEFITAGSSKKFGIVGFFFGGGKVVDVLPEDHNDYFALGVSCNEDPLCSVQVLEDIEESNVGGSRVVVFKGRGRGYVHRLASAKDDQDVEEAFTIMRN
nr:carboxymethylenebutenolidase homolog [Tanacetum cinerariifolium]